MLLFVCVDFSVVSQAGSPIRRAFLLQPTLRIYAAFALVLAIDYGFLTMALKGNGQDQDMLLYLLDAGVLLVILGVWMLKPLSAIHL